MSIQSIKQRFDIIGDDPVLNRAIDIAIQVANTDLSVLVTGESGVGKEVIPQIIHTNSARKHGAYIAVNCGAIPEGTIDSELFGHEKGAFTGAHDTRKGYFETANGGTIFLDEVAELPLTTQVRLLRVLQTGEFMKVGSSKSQKTNVRVVAATNINLPHAINTGRFREDLYYRLNTVPITLPPLRERTNDIHLLFRKFVLDFADKYKMPSIRLNPAAQDLLTQYRWPGNVRQLKNVAEQMSVLERERMIEPSILQKYLPTDSATQLPVLNTQSTSSNSDFMSERDLFYKVILQLRQEVAQLKEQVNQMVNGNISPSILPHPVQSSAMIHRDTELPNIETIDADYSYADEDTDDLMLSIPDVSANLIKRALEKHNGKRKAAAKELGISERTLYRKIKELNID